jgi:hypothetical protein
MAWKRFWPLKFLKFSLKFSIYIFFANEIKSNAIFDLLTYESMFASTIFDI